MRYFSGRKGIRHNYIKVVYSKREGTKGTDTRTDATGGRGEYWNSRGTETKHQGSWLNWQWVTK